MRTFTHRISKTFTAGMLATSLVVGTAVAAPPVAYAAKTSDNSSSAGTLSSDLGSPELQKYYNEQSESGKIVLSLIAVGAVFELIGFLVGPVRITLQDVQRQFPKLLNLPPLNLPPVRLP